MHSNCIASLNAAHKYLNAGKLKKASVLCRRVVSEFPGQPDALNMLAVIALRKREYPEVIEHLNKTIASRPREAIYHYNLGLALLNIGRYPEAVHSLETAVRLKPDLGFAYSDLCHVLNRLDEIDAAVTAGRHAVRLEPSNCRTHTNLAVALDATGSLDEALRHYQRAAELAPRNAVIRKNLGMACMELGDKEAAEQQLREAIALNPDFGEPYRYLSVLKKYSNPDDPDIILMQRLLEKPGLSGVDRTELHFALGKAHDDCGCYKEAFEQFAAGNRLENRRYDFKLRDFAFRVESLQSVFTEGFISARSEIGSQSELPVFVVGMPRSGTTLVEQILASHADAFGACELLWFSRIERGMKNILKTDEDYPYCLGSLERETVQALTGKYQTLLRDLSPEAVRIIDKMPENFLRIGLIRMLFPNAHIVHCCRDPRDTAISIYTNLFKGNLHWSYDLFNIGAYTALYQRMMQHWCDNVPGGFHEIRYEALVQNPEEITRQLVDYVGLPWDPACLSYYETDRRVRTSSHDQVRQPIYSSSIGRWKHYETFLGDFCKAMDAYGGTL